ncbi:hypothetical protein P9112_010791 [Eukaryota sp. TZLM1-RC]
MSVFNIAILGAGPASLYFTEYLLKQLPSAQVHIFERSPVPFGLLRKGVAPDHLQVKNVTKKLQKILENPRVRFFGNVNALYDIKLSELKTAYSAVVLATGSPRSRPLNIPNESPSTVFHSLRAISAWNGGSEPASIAPLLNSTHVVVVGIGNVSLDVARVLLKTPEQLRSDSEMPQVAIDALSSSRIRKVTILARRGPTTASCTYKELDEMKHLDAKIHIDSDVLHRDYGELDSSQQRKLDLFKKLVAWSNGDAERTLTFKFFTSPAEILLNDHSTNPSPAPNPGPSGLKCVENDIVNGKVVPSSKSFTISEPEQLGIVNATGFEVERMPGIPLNSKTGRIANEKGRIENGVYCTGWAKQVLSVVLSNKKCAVETVQTLLSDIENGMVETRGVFDIDGLLAERKIKPTTVDDWKMVDDFEKESGSDGQRAKFVNDDAILEFINSKA